jgi:hypothetical protein
MTDIKEKNEFEEMLESFRCLEAKGYAKRADADGTGYPVAVVCPETVPNRDVYWELGRALSREEIDRQFAKQQSSVRWF